jgi:hypothetical protein
MGVTVCLVKGGIESLESRRQDHGSHTEGDLLLLVVEIHGTGGAKLLTGPAFAFLKIDAVLTVDDVFERHGLGVGNVNGLPLHEAFVVFTDHFLRAFLGTGAAGDALLKVHETGMPEDIDFEAPFLSPDVHHLTQREEFDVEMPADLDQFGGKDSHGTIVRGKGLVQLGHDPSNGWRSLRQIDEVSRVGEVERRLHPRNAASHHQNRTGGSVVLFVGHDWLPFHPPPLFPSRRRGEDLDPCTIRERVKGPC